MTDRRLAHWRSCAFAAPALLALDHSYAPQRELSSNRSAFRERAFVRSHFDSNNATQTTFPRALNSPMTGLTSIRNSFKQAQTRPFAKRHRIPQRILSASYNMLGVQKKRPIGLASLDVQAQMFIPLTLYAAAVGGAIPLGVDVLTLSPTYFAIPELWAEDFNGQAAVADTR
jgi:hypothetical protein